MSRKKIIIVGVTLALCLGAAVMLVIAPQRSKIFRAYVPTTLPGGLKISTRSVSYDDTKVATGEEAFYSFWMTTNNPGVTIGEEKKVEGQFLTSDCGPGTFDQVCSDVKTSHGATYKLTTSYNQGKRFSCVVTAYKNNIRIFININESAVSYCDTDWSSLVDSLAPYDASHLPVEKVQPNRT